MIFERKDLVRILIDSNVIFDYLSVNKGFEEDATKIFELAIQKKAVELMSASAVTDIYYVLKKRYSSPSRALEELKIIREYIQVLPVTERDIDRAIERNWKDFEDAVQYTVAETNAVDYIITRDIKGYEETGIPVMQPREFIKKVIPKI